MRVKPIPDEPAICLDGRALVIADLHIGIEDELKLSGFILPSQTLKMGNRLASLAERIKARELIILGDLKHNIPRSTGSERYDIKKFFERVAGLFDKIDLIAGNHDGNIEYMVPPEVKIHNSKGIAVEGVGFAHGHTWPSKDVMACETLLMGHNHPVILFVDSLGFRSMQRCWVRARFSKRVERYERIPKEAIIMPSFSEICGGTAFNEVGCKVLGPLLNSDMVDLESARIHLLDGTYLGGLSGLLVRSNLRARKY